MGSSILEKCCILCLISTVEFECVSVFYSFSLASISVFDMQAVSEYILVSNSVRITGCSASRAVEHLLYGVENIDSECLLYIVESLRPD